MKQRMMKVMKVLFFPLIWCHRVIMDAPIVDVDNTFVGASEWRAYSAVPKKTFHVQVSQRAAVHAIHR